MKTTMKTLTIAAFAALMIGFAGAGKAEAQLVFHAGGTIGGVHVGVSTSHHHWPQLRGHRHGGHYYRPPIVYQGPVFTPTYHVITEREWIEPVYRRELVGYDSCGQPIWTRVLVRAGYWRTLRYQVDCYGNRVFLGYM